MLYEEWWNSLTEKQRKVIEERKRIIREQNDRELQESIMRLGIIESTLFGLSGKSYRHDKYHGIYGELDSLVYRRFMGKKNNLFLLCGISTCTITFILALIMAQDLSDLLLSVFCDGLLGVMFYLAHCVLNEKK